MDEIIEFRRLCEVMWMCKTLTDFAAAQRQAENYLRSVDRNARAYGWEIGHGQEMDEVLHSHPDNPFATLDTVSR